MVLVMVGLQQPLLQWHGRTIRSVEPMSLAVSAWDYPKPVGVLLPLGHQDRLVQFPLDCTNTAHGCHR